VSKKNKFGRITNYHEDPTHIEYSHHINRIMHSPPQKGTAQPVVTPKQPPHASLPTSNTGYHPPFTSISSSKSSTDLRQQCFSIFNNEINTQRKFNSQVDVHFTNLETSTRNIDSMVDLILNRLDQAIPMAHSQKKRPNLDTNHTPNHMYVSDSNIAMGN